MGKRFHVKHPDYCFLTPGNETIYLYSSETERDIVATRNITRVVPATRKTRTRKR